LLVDLLLKNAKIYTAEGIVKAGLAVEGGHIFKIAKETNLLKATEKIDLKGNLVLPGLIDSHVHLRDQQLAYKEDFFSGTAAAAAGGVTLALDMPNNEPVTMSLEALRERMRLAETKTIVNVGFFSAFPRSLGGVRSIVKEGAIGFKLYMSQGIGGLDIYDDEMLLQGLNKAREQNVPVAVHAENAEMLESARRKMENAGRRDIDAYLKVHSTIAETKTIKRVVKLIKKPSVHVHFCHVSSANGLSAILNAKNAGLRVTCEVTPHHLLLASDDLQRHGTLALTNPPLRTEENTKALWNALKQGSIDSIASDHAPHTLEEKNVESVWDAKPGIPGLETMLPLLLTQVNEGHLTIGDLVRVTSERPAEIFNLKAKGSVGEGYSADLVVVDVKQEYKIDSSRFYSKAKHSPFDGWKVKGKPVKTFVNGRLVMDEGEVVTKPGTGQIVRGES
jgi:dihydroorotase